MALDQALQEVVDILRRAFPSGLPQDDYLTMLVVLGDGLAEENLGLVVEEFTGIDRYLVLHEAVEAMTTKRPAATDIERVERALSDAGWSSDD